MTDDAMMDSVPLSDWETEPSPHVLAVVGKLGEEACELGNICFRIAIQGLDGKDPETGKPNIQALMEEIADVRAMSANAIARLQISEAAVARRAQGKLEWKRPWFDFTKSLPRRFHGET
jgi:hypothetical protein